MNLRKLLILLPLLLLPAAAQAQSEHSQIHMEYRDGLVSADIESRPIADVMGEFSEQTGIRAVVDDNAGSQAVSAHFAQARPKEAIIALLKDTKMNYAFLSDTNGKLASVFIGAPQEAHDWHKPGEYREPPPYPEDSTSGYGYPPPSPPPIPEYSTYQTPPAFYSFGANYGDYMAPPAYFPAYSDYQVILPIPSFTFFPHTHSSHHGHFHGSHGGRRGGH